jgi:predicted RNA-binding Zn-ribbon protein involved in translation (DUF1610 family)
MDFVDVRFINLISSRLPKFKRVKPDLYNFRCPICGDSEKTKNKARGYLYKIKTNTNYKCHNCGISLSFNNFLKQVDPALHKEYTLEKFKEGHTGKNFVAKEPKFEFEKPKFKKILKIGLPKASSNQDAKKYLEDRKLDPDKFYYTDKFKEWTNSKVHTFDDLTYDEPRIIIPLIYEDKFVGYQGRSLGPSKVKYITVMLDDDAPKIYGLDNVGRDAPIYVTEGPFDSTFICNAIAMCGADADVSRWGISNPVWIYDNEPRNREIVNRISKTIDAGHSVVIWPDHINVKDINDMVMSGLDVQSLVELNTYSGLQAKLKFTNWKKI